METVIGIDSKGNLLTQKTSLEQCLMKDCYAEFEFNNQGLAIKKSKNQNYKQGDNIYFSYPRENYVARFDAGSGGAGLCCGGVLAARMPRSGYLRAFSQEKINKK